MKHYRIRKYSPLWWVKESAPIILGIAIIASGIQKPPAPVDTQEPPPTPPTEEQRVEIDVLHESSAKTYMCYTMITDTTSRQHHYIYDSGEIIIDEQGFLRDEEGRYGVALGSYFGEIGSRYVFTMDTGIELPVVKVEEKADKDTIDGFIHKEDGSVIEFVVDTGTDYMKAQVWENGYIYGGNFNNVVEFAGKIVKIERVFNGTED